MLLCIMLSENRIYLASRSLRRRELLKQIGIKYSVLKMREALGRVVDVDEQPHENEIPTDYIYRITHTKATEGWKRIIQRRLPIYPVLTADTIVNIDGCILGKPENNEHAEVMLRALSGRSHQVLTAIAVCIQDNVQMRLSTSTVQFRDLSEPEIRNYLARNYILDKAGAYAIQGVAAIFITNIVGSYSGIMGLPLFETSQLLQETGLEILINEGVQYE